MGRQERSRERREGEKGEDERRVGRSMKGEILRRKRSNSLPIVELFKRGEKRKE